MKFTSILYYRHPKYYYQFSKFGWGLKKYKENFHKKWRFQIGINSKLPVEDYITDRKFEIPPGYVIQDPVDIVQNKSNVEFKQLPKERPWPFNKKELPGSRLDPNYKEQRELLFNRQSQLLEGFKGVLNFSNSILESNESLPDRIMENEDKLILDKEITEMLSRRLEWSDKLDSNNSRINQKFSWPRINKWTIPEYGPAWERREMNVLSTYADCSELLIAKQFGHFHYPKVISPKYEIGFKRDNYRCILDLRCDFITLQQDPLNVLFSNLKNNKLNHLFSRDFEKTKQKDLIDISPVSWEINFDPTHFYPNDESLNKLSKVNEYNVDTIFLGNNFNLHKPIPDRIIKGKLLLFMYGFAVGRARQLYGNPLDFEHESNYKELDKPITIKGIFINYSKRNLGFACLQLNTLNFNSEIKNQVWFDDAYDIIEDQETILKKMALMNLYSYKLLENN